MSRWMTSRSSGSAIASREATALAFQSDAAARSPATRARCRTRMSVRWSASADRYVRMSPSPVSYTHLFQAVRTGFQQQQTGYASSISLVFFVIVLAVSLVQRYLTRDKELKR